ncbi:hypothetical protein ACF09H_03180 [Streptomyces sp. NPDC014983]
MSQSTEELSHAVVEQLMAVIGAPDDAQVAGAADAAVRALDERLRAEAAA